MSAEQAQSGHERNFEIFVNAQPKKWAEESISFSQVVALAFPNPVTGGNIVYSVTYSRGPKENPQGTLVEGQSVQVKSGMVFDVTKTDKS
ncbi:hypothetical protein B2A_12020 [mine drainage metagenome]|uniref:Multi-ubiquitin domain-containing protein n=1 Tax=mine drainage metagenome TaxID=410659 RepID=T1A7B7_9ZZZZ